MKLGMPSLAEYNSIEENILLCEKLGLDFIELNMDLPYCMPDSKIDFKKIKENCSLDFTVHLSEKLEVGEICEEARKLQINLIKDVISYYKKEADIRKYNLHLDRGVYFTLPDKKLFIFEKYKDAYINSIKKSFSELSAFAKEAQVDICFENTKITGYIIEAFEELKKYDRLYYTLDIGHDAKDKEKASSFFMKSPEKIKHMHIHDFDGEKNHKELGIGIINIENYLAFCMANNLSGVIEVKREQELINSVNYIKSLGKNYFKKE